MNSQIAVEHVLVVPTELFHEIGHFQGFTANVGPYLETLFDPSYISYRPRDEVEQDPSFKQLIPYCIFRHEGNVFHYTRGKGMGEGRLHAKRSVGVGGHISSTDGQSGESVYRKAMWREIQEEVVLEAEFTESCVGLINDDLSDVGKVHLGILHLFELDAPKVQPRETSIIETGFANPAELIRQKDRFETWSQICLDYLLLAD